MKPIGSSVLAPTNPVLGHVNETACAESQRVIIRTSFDIHDHAERGTHCIACDVAVPNTYDGPTLMVDNGVQWCQYHFAILPMSFNCVASESFSMLCVKKGSFQFRFCFQISGPNDFTNYRKHICYELEHLLIPLILH